MFWKLFHLTLFDHKGMYSALQRVLQEICFQGPGRTCSSQMEKHETVSILVQLTPGKAGIL
jgi:hypothetical protein